MIYSVRRFSDEGGGEQKKESHTLRNTLLGAGAIAGGLMAGKAGLLGNRAAMSINKGWAKAGKMIGNEGMMMSGAQGYGQASAKNLASNLAKRTEGAVKLSDEQISSRASKVGDRFLGTLLK